MPCVIFQLEKNKNFILFILFFKKRCLGVAATGSHSLGEGIGRAPSPTP